MKNILFVMLVVVLFISMNSEPLIAENNSIKPKNCVMKLPEIQLGTIKSIVNKKFSKNNPSDFRFILKNKEISFKELTKGKNVILNFWGSLCDPCINEIPGLIEISDEYKTKDWIVIGILIEGNKNAKDENSSMQFNRISKLLEKHEIPYINIIGGNKLINELNMAYGGAKGTPTNIFINKSGKIYRTITGGLDKDVIELLMNDK